MKQKAFFIISKGLSIKQITQFFLEGVSPTLSAIKHNSSVLSKPKDYILWSKAAHQSANFWDFWVLRSNFIKFIMSILNWLVHSSFITHNSPVNFKLVHFLLYKLILWIKGSHQSPNFETSKHWWKFAKFLLPFLKACQFSFKFCINL